MTAFINTLKSKKYIIVKDDSVSYNLPKSPWNRGQIHPLSPALMVLV
jgi:hypothetical protein